jgi:hypothetical protein
MWYPPRMRPALVVVALVASASVAIPIDRQVVAQPSVAEADRFDAKLAAILERAGNGSRVPLRTTVTENELNAFLIHRARGQMAAGVLDPSVRILGGGRVTCRAIVDLDGVRDSRPRSWFDPMRVMSGKVPVSATGVVQARGGLGKIALESALVSGVQVPRFVMQELVTYFSRSPLYPDGITLDSTFALPVGIREIESQAGQAVIVQ